MALINTSIKSARYQLLPMYASMAAMLGGLRVGVPAALKSVAAPDERLWLNEVATNRVFETLDALEEVVAELSRVVDSWQSLVSSLTLFQLKAMLKKLLEDAAELR